jgi:hypothetical protein
VNVVTPYIRAVYLCNIFLLQFYNVTYTILFCRLLQILWCNHFRSVNVYWNLVCSLFSKNSICKLSNVCTSNIHKKKTTACLFSYVNLHMQQDQFSPSVCDDTEGSGRIEATVGQSQKIKVSIRLYKVTQHYIYLLLIIVDQIYH